MRKDLAIALVITVSFATFEARAQANYPCDNTAPNPYKLVSYDWGEGIQPWGGVRAVSVDSHDNLWVFSRCGDGDVHGDISQSCTGTKHAPVYELAPDGKMITHFGAGLFPGGHGIGVDSDGNVWVAEGQHVYKTGPDGKLLLTLGNGKKEVGDDTFNSATGVAFLSNGDVVISEGHGGPIPQARINIFSKDGKRLRSIGTYGSGEGQNLVIHDVATDAQDHIYAASEKRSGDQPGGGQVNVYDKDGKFLAAWKQFGNPGGLWVDKKNDMLYVIDSKSVPDTKSRLFDGSYSSLYNGGCVMGIRIGSVKDAKVKYYIPPPPVLDEKYKWLPAEGIAVDSHGAIYTGAEQQRTVEKYVLQEQSSAQAESASAPLVTLQMPARPNPVPVTLNPATTALLVFDYVNGICTRQAECSSMVPTLARFMARARKAGVVVGYGTRAHNASNWIPAIAPAPGDIKVTNTAQDRFYNTDLDKELKAKGITTVIMAGWSVNGSVTYTSVGATAHGYTVVVPIDTTSGNTDYQTAIGFFQILNQDDRNPTNQPLKPKTSTLSRTDLITFQ